MYFKKNCVVFQELITFGDQPSAALSLIPGNQFSQMNRLANIKKTIQVRFTIEIIT